MLTIQFDRDDWDRLPDEVRVWISRLCGPLWPDARGVVTMELSEENWEFIQGMMREIEVKR